jgi:hypothetical protein
MCDPPTTTIGNQVYRLPDTRLQAWATSLTGPLALGFVFTLNDGLSTFAPYLQAGLGFLMLTAIFLVWLSRQHTRLLAGEERFLLTRRLLGVRWREEILPFAEVERLEIVGDKAEAPLLALRRVTGRLIQAVRMDDSTLPLALADTPQAAQELAAELGRLLKRPVVETDPIAEARAILGLAETPHKLESEIRHMGRRLQVTLLPRRQRQHGTLLALGLAIGFGILLSHLYVAAYLHFEPETATTVFFVACILSVLGISWLLKQYGKPGTLTASRNGLEVDLPGWRRRRVHLHPASAVRVEVQGTADNPTLLVADGSRQFLVGHGAGIEELRWLRDALLKDLADDFAPREQPVRAELATARDESPATNEKEALNDPAESPDTGTQATAQGTQATAQGTWAPCTVAGTVHRHRAQ